MKSNITKFIFIIVIFICWSTPSTADDTFYPELLDYVDESFSVCQDKMVSLNAAISSIGQDFISSSVITCLNLTNNYIQTIAEGAFRNLPNLTHLDLSNNNFDNAAQLFSFGGHENLKVLILNNATRIKNEYYEIEIFGEYPNLEILSFRKNFFPDMWSSHTKFLERNPYPIHTSVDLISSESVTQGIPFPKLKILDLSENDMTGTGFVKLLPNSLHSLDLHNNLLTSLTLGDKGANLLMLNLDNNNLKCIKQSSVSSDSYNSYNKYHYNGYNSYDWYNQLSSNFNLTGLENLLYLSISGNEINFIGSDAFQNINKLVYLNLSANSISHLDSETFATLQSLSTLDLSYNQLESVPLISSETNISVLYLNRNKIKKIISNSFVQMPKLRKLLLGGNCIYEIDVKAFGYLPVLEKLDLSTNVLSSLPEGWTESLVSLTYLDLSDNKFTSLESLPLTSALSLIEVYLVINPLEYLNARYFKNLPQNLTINLMQRSSFAVNLNYYSCKLEALQID